MSLYISYSTNFPISDSLEEKLNKALSYIFKEEGITDSSINLKILTDEDIKELNKKFRNKNTTTNVLSFSNEDVSKSITGNLGDIAISYEFVKRESKEHKKNFDDHMIHMLVHGVYHILGFDHENDEMADIMEIKEVKLLKKLDIKNPY
ncbi:MAG: rRNA maturation RNase YbeY [SAR86 cluster bacterium]|uniref:Endoribonuclease YbeY n=1 Tax=SAR86 cluster bacterium TaxID=2030880 RepID=A0A520MWC0_9GAMM|nr:MAG: rRNA maturation RNase YbeY [SAR86 cluster bacterium]